MKKRILVWILASISVLAVAGVSRVEAQGENLSDTVKKETYIHVVVKGDTLWDICEGLYGDPWVWPKVWKLNAHITNPHWIYPGTQLRVYYEVPKPTETLPVVEEAAPALPPPPPPPPPPPKAPTITYKEIDQVGFITPDKPPDVGLVVGEINQKVLIGMSDEVFVQFREPGQASAGDHYFIFRTSDLIYHPITDKRVGYLNTIRGILRIQEVAPDHAKAVIVTSFDPIIASDRLMPYEKRSEEIVIQAATEAKEGTIVLSERHQYLMGDHQIVFIDLGEDQEIKVGHRFQVFRRARAKKYLVRGDSDLIVRDQPIGEVLVLLVEKETATALVTQSDIEFIPGERVRLKTEN